MSDKKLLQIVLVLLLVLLLMACGVATLLTILDTALSLASQAAAVTGAVPPAYVAYVTAALGCVSFAGIELASMDTNGEKTGKIVAQCAALTAPGLPPGTPQNLVTLASKLGAQIAALIDALPKMSEASRAKGLTFTPEQIEHLKQVAADANAARSTFSRIPHAQ